MSMYVHQRVEDAIGHRDHIAITTSAPTIINWTTRPSPSHGFFTIRPDVTSNATPALASITGSCSWGTITVVPSRTRSVHAARAPNNVGVQVRLHDRHGHRYLHDR